MFLIPPKKSKASDPFYDEKFHHIFNSLYVPLCNYCYFLIDNYEAAEDIVQDLFLHLWENWGKMNSIELFKGYLYKAVKNRSINYLKQEKKVKLNYADDYASEYLFDNKLPLACEMMENAELENIIEKAVEELPSRCRTIFLLSRVDEMSNKEISKELNISVKTVEAQMTIALKRMYQYVSKHW